MPATKRSGKEEHSKEHISGAVFFDLDECRDKNARFGEQILPNVADFEKYVGSLGISDSDHVVLYDNNDMVGMFSAPRAWFTFQVFGHRKLSVLDGGLPEWKRQGQEVTAQATDVVKATYKGKYKPEMVVSYEDLQRNLETKEKIYVDSRPLPRFLGQSPEPVPGIKPGRVPGSVNIPYVKVLQSDPKVYKSKSELEKAFKDHGIDFSKPTILGCGTGLSACHVLLAARLCGFTDILPVYDGSWTEWFQRAPKDQMVDVPEN
ncbi:hypothetical protein CAPTEDRAFT_196259 [Capitella teleta]|uniref:Rhodanese domain-containing protein n=1 Tax=Capitella teleta TaxID=283909 RepID=R7U001_CAPTE|nr:hypothetical protein CAPTEDRAFT_196259 [Capitella teleta]|eukprot:ELT99197.1 hypothetical protein CAPTEDRAFT_196259 [Capitella teleta]